MEIQNVVNFKDFFVFLNSSYFFLKICFKEFEILDTCEVD